MLRSFFLLLLGGIILARAVATDRFLQRVVELVFFMVFLSLGLDALGSNPQVPRAGAVVGCAGTSVLCGFAIAEFIYGHVGDSASVKLLTAAKINLNLVGAMMLRMFFGICAPLMEVRWPTGDFWQQHAAAMVIRWAIGLMAPMVLLCMAQQRLRQKDLRRWRAYLFPAMVMILIGEAIALHLTRLTGLPF